MAKVLDTYRGYSAADIVARASDTCDIVVGSTGVDCTNVKMSKVKNVLGASTYSLYDLCRHANVNQYSGFSPYILSYSNSGTLNATLAFTKPTVCKLGDFAGYNHNAITPATDHYYKPTWVMQGSTVTMDAYINIGEMRFPSPAVGLCLSLWDGATLIGFGITALSGVKDTNIFITAETSAINANTTITSKVFIIDSTTEFQQNGSNCLCKAVNVVDVDHYVQVILPSTFTLDGVLASEVLNEGINYTLGQIAWDQATKSYDITELTVRATLTNYDGSINESIVMFQGAVTSGVPFYPDAPGYAQFVTAPISSYGFTARLVFEESI